MSAPFVASSGPLASKSLVIVTIRDEHGGICALGSVPFAVVSPVAVPLVEEDVKKVSVAHGRGG